MNTNKIKTRDFFPRFEEYQHKTIQEKIDYFSSRTTFLLQGVYKNPATLISLGFSATSLGVFIKYFSEGNFESSFGAILLTIFSSVGVLNTRLGITTMVFYEKTKKHIERFGKIDKRFFQKLVGYEAYDEINGYCQLQGMYLACKELEGKYPGITEQFLKLRREKTNNIIPII